MKSAKPDPVNWIIYPNGLGGWFAWHRQTNDRIDLVFVGVFSEAVATFNSKIGDYYSSR